jgi:large subunit ribosomal protein L1
MKETTKKSAKSTNKEINDGVIKEVSTVTSPATQEVTTKEVTSKPLAKAGKRSAKAVVEAEEKQVKASRKAKSGEELAKAGKPKISVKPARSRAERAGKKYREVTKLVEKGKEYSLKEAVELALKTSTTKFDSTVELHVNLNVDPKQADQNLRDNLTLPAGTGKTVRIAVFADTDDVKAAKTAGADIAGSDEFLQQLDKNIIDFDLLITAPTMMPKLAKYARLLGPKGLMPNPKSGTVTTNIVKAIEQSKAGRLEYRVDSTGIVHSGIGKVSFGTEKIQQNAEAVLASIKGNKPASVKTALIKSVHLTTSMGPSAKVAISEL